MDMMRQAKDFQEGGQKMEKEKRFIRDMRDLKEFISANKRREDYFNQIMDRVISRDLK